MQNVPASRQFDKCSNYLSIMVALFMLAIFYQFGHASTGNASDALAAQDEIYAALDTATTIAAGGYHSCALTSLGGVKCWGRNDFGQLGDGASVSRLTPVDVVGLSSGVSAIALGREHSCALTSLGGVKCWGRNDFGQLGDGTSVNRLTPVDVVGLSSGVSAIATYSDYVCALTSLGGVKCWGRNDFGQLGDSTSVNRLTPVDVVGLNSGVSVIALGREHSCALTSLGGVKCWGSNGFGQLGNGAADDRSTPVDVVGLSSGVSTITASGGHTCALTISGGVKCWGHNGFGQLGDGTSEFPSTPVDVVGLSSGVFAITAGGGHTCVLTTSVGVECWGYNGFGQLGDGTFKDRSTPVGVVGLGSGVSVITAGSYHNCALTASGEIKCWGHNDSGQLGDGTSTSRFTPSVDAEALSSGVSAIAAGALHTCAEMISGGVKCWGQNVLGQLGDGTFGNRSTPVDVVGLSNDVSIIAGGGGHTCALTVLRGVKCWGYNALSQVGDGTSVDRSTPVDVVGLSSGVTAIDAGYYHSCALTISGGVKCWGHNDFGQLGDGTSEVRPTSVDVVGLSSGVSAIAAGGLHTCALTTSEGVKCWGKNFDGQLGDGTSEDRSTPVDVVGLSSGVSAIATGNGYSCALTTLGGVKCWGHNITGQLGDGTSVSRFTPVDVAGLNSGVSAIAAGGGHTCALTALGEVKCWGLNDFGQLGDGTSEVRLTPVDVVGLSSGVTAIDAGYYHSCALTTLGGVKCWGTNDDGQLGINPGWLPVDVVGFRSTARLAAETSCILQTDSDGDGFVSAGDIVRCMATMRNDGDGMAMNAVYRNNLDANIILVTGSVQTSMGNVLRGNSDGDRAIVVNIGNLMPGGSATVQFDLQVNGALPDDIEFIEIPGSIGCDGHPVITPGRPGGAPGAPGIPIGGRPIISADKSAVLLVDLDGNGIAGPGDTLEYTAILYNSGTAVAPQSSFVDQLDPNTTLIVGSVTTSQGTVVSGNNPGDASVNVDMGEIAPNASVTIRFKVRINRNLSSSVTQLANLAVCIYPDAPPACVGRPGPYGTCTPSQTPLTSQPLLPSTKNGSLYIDADENGFPSPGDTLVYQIRIENVGNAAATNVVVTDQLDANVSLVEGSVRIDREATYTLNGALLTINIGRIEPGESVNISFEVQVLDTLPSGTTLLQNQCRISSNELAPILIGDPGVPLTSGPGVPNLTLPPNVTLTKSSVLVTDTGVRNESVGDTLLYLINIVNQGRGVAANVVIEDPLDPNVTLIEASVQTSKGVISIERSGGITTVRVNIGTLNPGESVQIGFRVTINSDAPAQRIVNQCRLTYTDADGNNQNTVLSDDPNTLAPNDATEALLRTGTFLPVIWNPSVCEEVEASPIDVVLVTDRSTSMLDEGKFAAAKLAASGFLDQMDFNQEQAAIASFAGAAALDQQLTNDRVALDAALANLAASAGTAIGDGLTVATTELQSTRYRASNSPAIILLSDGANNSGSDPIAAANNAKAAGIRIFTIGFGSDADAALLQQIATNPDNYFFAPGPDDLAQIYQEIASVVRCTQ